MYDLPELNNSQVYSIYNRSWAKHIYSFSPQDSASLLSVALQNPNSGGHAVYTARIMLGLDFMAAYSGNSAMRKGSTPIKTSDKENDLLVYPNPANNILSFEFSGDINTNTQIIIYDIFGKEIIHRDFSQKRLINMDINSLANGIYFYKVYYNMSMESGKFIKQ